MLLKNNINYFMERIKNKEMTKTDAANQLQCTRQWITELYKRYSKNESLEKKRGHRNKCLCKDEQNELSELFKYLTYEENGILYTPSMEILKVLMLEQNPKFPEICIETMRNYLKENNQYPKKIKSKKYRKRFEAIYVGELVQGDVSTHRWIPDIEEKYHLILFIDDKSRYVLYAKFVESDNLINHIFALKQMFNTFGLPIAIYYDNDSKYSYIRHGGDHFDQRTENPDLVIPSALREIGVNLINSKPFQPQGKGKVERKFLTFQKQLPFYLKMRGAKNIDDANIVLEDYIIKHNKTYSRAIKTTPEEVFQNSDDAFRDLRQIDLENIENALTKRAIRKVTKVNEISYKNVIYTVPRYKKYSLANYEIEVRENPDQWIKLFYKDNLLTKYNLRSTI